METLADLGSLAQASSAIWEQNYNPFDNIFISALVAAVPIIFFFVCLVGFKLKGYSAAFLSVVLASLVAVFAYDMPILKVLYSLLYGVLFGLYPIGWIIIAAIFLYKLTVKSGYFDILRESIITITPDMRLQVILIAFCFGAFLEGTIGFGGPVAITAALLVGMGIKPIQAAGLCLIANLPPATFGAVGIPVTALANLVQVDALKISTMSAIMLAPFSFCIPFLLVFLLSGFKGVRESAPACFVAGFSFISAKIITASFFGPELPDITAGIVSITALGAFLKVWKPKNIMLAENKSVQGVDSKIAQDSLDSKVLIESLNAPKPRTISVKQTLLSGAPFGILIFIIVIWTQDWFNALFASGGALEFLTLKFNFKELSEIYQVAPIVAESKAVKSLFEIPLINSVGSAIFLAALCTAMILKIKPKVALSAFSETFKEMYLAVVTICLVLAFAYVSNYSGISATLALALSKTGESFIFFSPIVGWLGVVLTGSVTSSNVLFGSLQQLTAGQLGINEVLLLSANAIGGATGKMISLQSIAVAASVVGLVGKEAQVLGYTLKYSLILALGSGVACLITAFAFPFIVP
ncbi:L-lactate permease [Helicobacter sp. MIT 00-7814]|uniref:L-lactate permease n=1 Tax=unclassified Helicobacter TaxID=2593540 RepID=UPI000E1F6585|nr:MULTISPECIES: lactate permease LctP family transporter [unclassified Helicobacter]RDU56402.1 L-lactate permease [Helicobacter sp. MIT 99-10781]RDU56485.1 L-lactate permease [Helicobacter sp. MIT 00-7814]